MKQKVIKFTNDKQDKLEGKLIQHDKEYYEVIFKGNVIYFNRATGISTDNKFTLINL